LERVYTVRHPTGFIQCRGCDLNSEIRTDIDECKLRRKYRIRVAIFVLSVGLALVVLSTGYDAIRTLSNLETMEHERDQWQRPGDVIQELNLKKGNVVVDLGSGVGYFALKLAPSVGRSGKVLAVDIQKFPLRVLRIRAVLSVEDNIDTILGESDNPHLPPGSVDAVLIANTYHELTHAGAVLDQLFRSLKPGGRLVIVDRGPPVGKRETPHAATKRHEIAPELVEGDIRRQGFEVVRREDHFTQQPVEDYNWWLIVSRKPLPVRDVR
jgi:ubiquinone/menaquinone biosynthesis C-methylase UbiE